MADVFISYSQRDVANARMLAALLAANNHTVWWDNHLEGGDQFRQKIAAQLASARAVIVIWSKNSVASDWVQSEAGRALADGKLVPVRSPDIDYNEIPPPFENRHTLKLDQTEQVLAAIAAQLAKPAAAGPRWKVIRYEALLWLGVIGGAITLTNMVGGLFKLSAALSWLLSNWSALLKHFWQLVLLFKVDLSPYDAQLLTAFVLMNSAVFYASARRSSAADLDWTISSPDETIVSIISFPLTLALIGVTIFVGVSDIAARDAAKALRLWELSVERVFADDKKCVEVVKTDPYDKLRPSKKDKEPEHRKKMDLQDQKDKCLSARGAGLRSGPAREYFGQGASWGPIVRPTAIPFADNFFLVVFLTAPVFLPFVLLFSLSAIFRLKLREQVLARRLWRTLLLFFGILVANFVVLHFENWLKAIPHEL